MVSPAPRKTRFTPGVIKGAEKKPDAAAVSEESPSADGQAGSRPRQPVIPSAVDAKSYEEASPAGMGGAQDPVRVADSILSGQLPSKPEEVLSAAHALKNALREGGIPQPKGAEALFRLIEENRWDGNEVREIYKGLGELGFTPGVLRGGAARTTPVLIGIAEGITRAAHSDAAEACLKETVTRLSWAASCAKKVGDRITAQDRLEELRPLLAGSPFAGAITLPEKGGLPQPEKGRAMSWEMLSAHFAERLKSADPEEFKAVLSQIPRFRTYSMRNTMLIFLANPDARVVGGKRKWDELGYQVKPSETKNGIPIIGFNPAKPKSNEPAPEPEPETEGASESDGPEESQAAARDPKKPHVKWPTVYVYDFSQVEPIPGREQLDIHGLEAGKIDGVVTPEMMRALEKALEKDGIEFQIRDGLGRLAQFHYGTSFGGRIAVLSGMPPEKTFATGVHEYAHEVLHQPSTEEGTDDSTSFIRKGTLRNGAAISRQQAELEAEFTAFLVCHKLGLDTSHASSHYLRGYGVTESQLRESTELCFKAADKILSRLKTQMPGEGPGGGQPATESESAAEAPVLPSPGKARLMNDADWRAMGVPEVGTPEGAAALQRRMEVQGPGRDASRSVASIPDGFFDGAPVRKGIPPALEVGQACKIFVKTVDGSKWIPGQIDAVYQVAGREKGYPYLYDVSWSNPEGRDGFGAARVGIEKISVGVEPGPQDAAEAKKLAQSLLRGTQSCFLDSETTHLDGDGEVISLSVRDRDGDFLFSMKFRPSQPIPDLVSEKIGVSNLEAMTEDATFEAQFGRLCEALKGRDVVAYNAAFDRRMIAQTSAFFGLPDPTGEARWHDAMEMAKAFLGEQKYPKLEDACQKLGVNISQVHTADGDSLGLLGLVKTISKRPLTLDDEFNAGIKRAEYFHWQPAMVLCTGVAAAAQRHGFSSEYFKLDAKATRAPIGSANSSLDYEKGIDALTRDVVTHKLLERFANGEKVSLRDVGDALLSSVVQANRYGHAFGHPDVDHAKEILERAKSDKDPYKGWERAKSARLQWAVAKNDFQDRLEKVKGRLALAEAFGADKDRLEEAKAGLVPQIQVADEALNQASAEFHQAWESARSSSVEKWHLLLEPVSTLHTSDGDFRVNAADPSSQFIYSYGALLVKAAMNPNEAERLASKNNGGRGMKDDQLLPMFREKTGLKGLRDARALGHSPAGPDPEKQPGLVWLQVQGGAVLPMREGDYRLAKRTGFDNILHSGLNGEPFVFCKGDAPVGLAPAIRIQAVGAETPFFASVEADQADAAIRSKVGQKTNA